MFAARTMKTLGWARRRTRRSGALRGIAAAAAIAACGLLAAPPASVAVELAPVLSAEAGDSSVDLSWTMSVDNTHHFTDGYEWRKRTEGESTWGSWNRMDLFDWHSTSVTDLTNGTTYEFQVRARYKSGDFWNWSVSYSEPSNTVTATPTESDSTESE